MPYHGHVSIEQNATTTEVFYPSPAGTFLHITNDGDDAIVFNVDGTTTSEGKFTLKAGESLKFDRGAKTGIYVRAVSGTQAFRVVGLT